MFNLRNMSRYNNLVGRINRYQASVKCAVKIGTKCNTIVHLVVLAYAKRNNVAGINEIIAERRFNTHSGEAARNWRSQIAASNVF